MQAEATVFEFNGYALYKSGHVRFTTREAAEWAREQVFLSIDQGVTNLQSELFLRWCDVLEFDDRQRLLVYATAFVPRVLQGLVDFYRSTEVVAYRKLRNSSVK